MQRLTAVLLLMALTTFLVPKISPANATGLLYIDPVNTSNMAVGGTFSVQALVSGMDLFQGWDIQVVSDPTVINATSLSVTGNILSSGTTFELVHCVNGDVNNGKLCDIASDGPGIVHSALASIQSASGAGLLFVITYKVVSSGQYSAITFRNDQISHAGSSVNHTTQIGSYGTQFPPDFTISATSPSAFVGGSPISTITVTGVNGFGGTVNLSDTISQGLACQPISPPSVTLTASPQTAALSCTSSVEAAYSVTVNGTSGALKHAATAAFTFGAPPTFTIGISSPPTVAAGQSALASITVAALNGFSGTVSLSDTPLPTGLTCQPFAPAVLTLPPSPATATLVCSSLTAAIYSVTITGTNNSLIHTTSATFTFVDFGISANPTSITEFPGASSTSAILLTSIKGFSGRINLTATASSTSITAVVNPIQITLNGGDTANVVLNVTASVLAAASIYSIQVSGAAPGLLHSTTVSVSVQATPDFALNAFPDQLYLHAASSGRTIINVKSENLFSGQVTLTVQAPKRATASIAPGILTIESGQSANATMTLTIPDSVLSFAAPNSFVFYVTASSGTISHTLRVLVDPPTADFIVIANPPLSSILAGNTGTISVEITSLNYYSGTIALFGTAQSGVTFSFKPASFYLNVSRTVVSILSITTDSASQIGDHSIMLTALGVGTEFRHNVNVTLTITAITRAASTGSRSIFGLDPSYYFSIILGAAAVVAVLGVREWRRPVVKSRPILD